jgi:RimJ/RimL family protein N-acetyltransferase
LRDAFPHPYTLEDAEKFIANSTKKQPTEIFAIEYKGEYVGNIGLHKATDVYRKSAEIGYFLGEPYWNKGIMSQAVQLICEYGFKNLDIVRIHTGVFEFNTASQKVLEKCGFQKEGVFKKAICKNDIMYDEIRFALVKNDISQDLTTL